MLLPNLQYSTVDPYPDPIWIYFQSALSQAERCPGKRWDIETDYAALQTLCNMPFFHSMVSQNKDFN